MKLKKIILTAAAVMSMAAMLACSASTTTKTASYKDGTYTGRSLDHTEDESGNGSGYGTVELTITDGKVTACTFEMYELDGTLKDDTYGADLSKENRLKAQKAVQSATKYAEMLVSAGSIDGVDAISGATISYSEFNEAVDDALAKAAE